ncbi:MAG: hypothetical protein K2O84_11835 [Oscillospiraceae bacterium]|jgi:hypothetical protein|nr:hypothetical protein [Oscillospiraceae bacterium]
MKKRILSLTLALLMALSVMAFPAAAYEEEGIMPLVSWGYCPRCMKEVVIETETYRPGGIFRVPDGNCNTGTIAHEHQNYYDYNIFQCASCNYPEQRIATHVLCLANRNWLS